MFNFFKKTNSEIKEAVITELSRDKSLSSSQIEVSAYDGVVTLYGSVSHYIEKITAEHAAQKVSGVNAVVDKLEVKIKHDRSDEQIARAALSALKWRNSVPANIQVTVEKGWVKLDGEADWDYQRNEAQNCVKDLVGVCGVSNHINLKSRIKSSDVKIGIDEELGGSDRSLGNLINVF